MQTAAAEEEDSRGLDAFFLAARVDEDVELEFATGAESGELEVLLGEGHHFCREDCSVEIDVDLFFVGLSVDIPGHGEPYAVDERGDVSGIGLGVVHKFRIELDGSTKGAHHAAVAVGHRGDAHVAYDNRRKSGLGGNIDGGAGRSRAFGTDNGVTARIASTSEEAEGSDCDSRTEKNLFKVHESTSNLFSLKIHKKKPKCKGKNKKNSDFSETFRLDYPFLRFL